MYVSITKYEKKIFNVGDSHIKRVRRNIFNNSIAYGNAYLKSFNGAEVRHFFDHFIELTLSEDNPEMLYFTSVPVTQLIEMWKI